MTQKTTTITTFRGGIRARLFPGTCKRESPALNHSRALELYRVFLLFIFFKFICAAVPLENFSSEHTMQVISLSRGPRDFLKISPPFPRPKHSSLLDATFLTGGKKKKHRHRQQS